MGKKILMVDQEKKNNNNLTILKGNATLRDVSFKVKNFTNNEF